MSAEVHDALAAIARRWVEDGWRAGDGADVCGRVIDELHAPDFIDHDSAGRAGDNTGFRDGIARLFAAFPDFHAEVREVVAEVASDHRAGADPSGAGPGAVNGRVAVRWTAVGTHRGDYLGAGPTGRRIVFKGIEIVHVRDGLITDRWGEWDGFELLAQLGREV